MALGSLAPSPLRTAVAKPLLGRRAGRVRNVSVRAAFMVRPYTTRKGDTFESIAEKRGFEVEELKQLNHQLDTNALEDGVTILVPADQLSVRDKDIISGIGKHSYRTYPVRKGETVEDIIAKRGISMAEMEKLNPDVELGKVKANQILKLPAGKYTVREKEMLMGTAGVPNEFFQSKGFVFSASILGLAVVLTIVTWLKEKSKGDDA
ncbi:hypothetical protein BSKO_07840 [Bryopsis sp. KO-2023]|nr:hypothetical protein BSKO_07840 [Bryopsis sp. KO-2023]